MHRKWLSAALVGAASWWPAPRSRTRRKFSRSAASARCRAAAPPGVSRPSAAWRSRSRRSMRRGGFKAGGKTYKLELIMYDDQYTGAGGKAAAERLVNQDKVKFIIGPVGSPPALGVISVTNPAKVHRADQRLRPADPEERHQGPLQFPHLPDQHRVRAAAHQVAQGERAGDQEGRHAGAQRCGRPIGRRRARRGLSQAGLRGRWSTCSSAASRSSRR